MLMVKGVSDYDQKYSWLYQWNHISFLPLHLVLWYMVLILPSSFQDILVFYGVQVIFICRWKPNSADICIIYNKILQRWEKQNQGSPWPIGLVWWSQFDDIPNCYNKSRQHCRSFEVRHVIYGKFISLGSEYEVFLGCLPTFNIPNKFLNFQCCVISNSKL